MKRKRGFLLITALFCVSLLICCSRRQPLRLGYFAELSGPRSEMGINGRDGAQLAVDEINAAGGIDGTLLQLITRDNKGIAGNSLKAVQELMHEGVAAIISHATSEQTAETLSFINQNKVVLLGITTTSSDFSAKKDYFFRVAPDNDIMGTALADYLHENYGFPAYLGIYDICNRAFSVSILKIVDTRLREYGEKIDASIPFDACQDDLRIIAEKVISHQPQGVIIAAAPLETAYLAQHLRRLDLQIQLFGTVWAHTKTLIDKGGRAVQGMVLITDITTLEDTPVFRDFTKHFMERYGRPPALDSYHTYEAIYIIAKALQQTGGKSEGLAEALLSIQDFPGLLGKISFDAYGDVKRDVYIIKVNGNQFTTLKVFPPKKITNQDEK